MLAVAVPVVAVSVVSAIFKQLVLPARLHIIYHLEAAAATASENDPLGVRLTQCPRLGPAEFLQLPATNNLTELSWFLAKNQMEIA